MKLGSTGCVVNVDVTELHPSVALKTTVVLSGTLFKTKGLIVPVVGPVKL